MLVSCICVSHNKPDLAHEAIQSILDQTYPHWQALIVDSGVLYDAGYYDRFAWRDDRRVTVIRSSETPELRRTKAMAPWCFNECFRAGLVRGDLVMYLCDDDILYPNAFATFVDYCRQHPDAQAMYASQDLGVIWPDGRRSIVGERRATKVGGKYCHGRRMDCEVDYLQFCHRAEVLRNFPGDEYWPEGKDTESHADGIFLERIGESVPIYPIDVKASQNRRTPQSLNDPVDSVPWMENLAADEASDQIRERCRRLSKAAARWRAEAECWRQQFLLNQSFVQALSQSFAWKLLAPLRALRRMIRPRGFDARALIPLRQLERDENAATGAWIAIGPEPCFIVPCEMPAGWLRLRVRIASDVAGRFEVIASGGNGISDAEVIIQADVNKSLDLECKVQLPRPALGLHINPLSTAGSFELKEFTVTPLSWRRRLSKTLRSCPVVARLLPIAGWPGLSLRSPGARQAGAAEDSSPGHPSHNFGVVGPVGSVGLDDSAHPTELAPAQHNGFKSRRQPINARRQADIEYPDLCLPSQTSFDWSIIVPTVNDVERVQRCISTCRQHLPPGLSVEFIVVDDGTRDAVIQRELERQAIALDFHLLRNQQNLGFSASVNHGMRLARGRYIALCNNDIVFCQPCLDALQRAFDWSPEIGVVGCKLLYPTGAVQHAGMDKVPGQLRWTHTFHGYPAEHPAACTSRHVWSVTGALCAFRRSTLQRLGGFSTAYTLAYEDLDYCLRAWTERMRVYYCAEAVAIHEESGTLGRTRRARKSRPLVWSERERASRRYFQRKWRKLRDVGSFEELLGERVPSLLRAGPDA